MKETGGSDDQKRRAAESAVEAVEDGMVVGLGTGSTTAHAIRALGERVDAGLDVTGVATSFQARELAREVGVPVASLPDVVDADGGGGIDVAIDGADQVVGVGPTASDVGVDTTASDGGVEDSPSGPDADAAWTLVKGGGAAHVREKLVDAAADAFHVVVDPSKLAGAVSRPIPVEVLPAARTTVASAVADAGGTATLRRADRKDGPVVTDNGNLVLDCDFGTITDPASLDRTLSGTPGVVDHGLFVDLADVVHVGTDDGVDVHHVTRD